jgi:NTP pyrophosphatase (non-canonical NTP hydrolase)
VITADEYQRKCYKFENHTHYGPRGHALVFGLTSEAGEVAGEYEKSLRNGGYLNVHNVAIELGDVLWNVARIAEHYNYTLTEIMEMNLAKLEQRYAERDLPVNEV